MNTPNVEKNGSKTPSNLSYEQRLLANHTGLDTLPGFVVVVFERLKGGGARFRKLINSGEIFKNFTFSLLDSPQNYFSVAVNQSILRYAFDEPVILDDNFHKFTLIFHLTFRTANPRMVAEIASQDPLQRLRHEIARTAVRSCAQRDWEVIKEHFRELELIVINAEMPKLRQFAATLGIEILKIELDSRLPEHETKVERTRDETDKNIQVFGIKQNLSDLQRDALRAREYEEQRREVDQEHDLVSRGLDKKLERQDKETKVRRAEHYQQILDKRDEAVGNVFITMGQQIDNPDNLVETVDAFRNINSVLQSDRLAASGQAGLESGFLGPDRPQLGPGEDKVSSLLGHAFGEIEQLKLLSAQKRALTSNILHLTAEALLDDAADAEVLKKYGEQLSELASNLELSKKQCRELRRFLDHEALREYLR